MELHPCELVVHCFLKTACSFDATLSCGRGWARNQFPAYGSSFANSHNSGQTRIMKTSLRPTTNSIPKSLRERPTPRAHKSLSVPTCARSGHWRTGAKQMSPKKISSGQRAAQRKTAYWIRPPARYSRGERPVAAVNCREKTEGELKPRCSAISATGSLLARRSSAARSSRSFV